MWVKSKNRYKGPKDKDNIAGIDCGNGKKGRAGQGGAMGEILEQL